MRECGYLSIQDFRDGLCDIGVVVPFEEIELFFIHFDRDRDGLLSFSEFNEAFTPLEPYYATIIGRRTSSYRRVNPFKKDEIFEPHTAV